MKIDFITTHYNYNQGSALLTYALFSYLKKRYGKAEVIDYRPSYQNHFLSYKGLPSSPWNTFSGKFIRFLKHTFWKLTKSKQRKKFDKFYSNICSSEKYRKLSELVKSPPDADVFIAGGDQIWNSTDYECGRDPAFFLDFVPDGKTKLSYAASFGSARAFDESDKERIEKLRTFSAVSVRETASADLLKEKGINAQRVLDPTFLLDKSEWRSIKTKTKLNAKGSIVIYALDDSKEIYDALKPFIRKRRIIAIGERAVKASGIDVDKDISPTEFLSYIDDADTVITNAYHGLIFSLIFEKRFICLKRNDRMTSIRCEDLVSVLGIKDEAYLFDLNKEIDYESINRRLAYEKEQSENFLNLAISPKNQECHVGLCLDEELYEDAASGGIMSCAAREILKNGGVVYGAALFRQEQFECRHIRVDKERDLHLISDSKYMRSDIGDSYKMAEEDLANGKTVLFCGTSCQIAGLYKYIEKKSKSRDVGDKLFTIDFVCHGYPDIRMFNEYIAYFEKTENCKVTDFCFKAKNSPGFEFPVTGRVYNRIHALYPDGKTKVIFIKDLYSPYMRIFRNCAGYISGCYSCKYARMMKPSDITAGDFYIPTEKEIRELNLNSSKVYSSVILNTQNGKRLFETIKGYCDMRDYDRECMMKRHRNLNHPSTVKNEGAKLLEIYKTAGFEGVSKELDKLNTTSV